MFNEFHGKGNALTIHVRAGNSENIVELCTYDPDERCDYQIAAFTIPQIAEIADYLQEIVKSHSEPLPQAKAA